MCLCVDNNLTKQMLSGIDPKQEWTFYKRLSVSSGKLFTPVRHTAITRKTVYIRNPIKRNSRIKNIYGQALHLNTRHYHSFWRSDIVIRVKVLTKDIIKFGTCNEVCVSKYKINDNTAKKYNLK